MTDRRNVTDLLEERARGHPGRGYLFLADGETEGERASFADLWREARAFAVRLRQHVEPGDRALLLLPPSLDFLRAFFGCLAAGVVAVPAYPPGSRRTWPRLRAVAGDAAPAVAVVPAEALGRYEKALPELPELGGVKLLALPRTGEEGVADAWRRPAVEAETVAFLQYTSGSTSDPKGVRVTHGNLLHNGEMIRSAFGQDESSVVVGWLPLYHDMGLIGNVLQPLFAGSRCVLMPPSAFLQRPVRWLRALSRYRGTTSGGPDFAFDLCVRKIPPEEREGLDLSSWSVAFDGSEPVRAETLERFAAAYEPYGFRREAFYPCYGLAEATLFVTGGVAGEGARIAALDPASLEAGTAVPAPAEEGDARRVVGCGRAWADQRIAVADPKTGDELPEGSVGEIWLAGPSVAAGYRGRSAETERTFAARLAAGEGPFLRTGDLGFLRGGELFVTGRLEDLIVLRGRNLYPQDLEATAVEAHGDLRRGGVAAFTVPAEGGDELVLACELRRRATAPRREVVEAVRGAIAEVFGARAHRVELLRPGQVARTTSGKLRRSETRDRYLRGELEPAPRPAPDELAPAEDRVAESPAPSVEARLEDLRRWVAALLDLPLAEVRPSVALTALGLDSLGAAQLSQELAETFGSTVTPGELLDGADLLTVAARCGRTGGETEEAVPPLVPGEPRERFPLTPGQRALWFLARLAPESAAYHIAAAARVRGPLDTEALQLALASLVARHPSLRTTFHDREGRPFQRVHGEGGLDFSEAGAEDWSEEDLARALRREAFRPFDLECGPLLRVSVFRRGVEDHELVLAVHHLVADFWSLAVLVAELRLLYRPLGAGRGEGGVDPGDLPLVPATFSDHERSQRRLLEGPRGQVLASYWRRAFPKPPPDLELATDRPRPLVATDRGDTAPFALGRAGADALDRLARDRGVTPFVVLLAGFHALLHRLTGQEELVVGCPSAGRDAAGAEGVVGYFVNPVPVGVTAGPGLSFDELVAAVWRSCRGAFDHGDYPFPLLAERLQPRRDPGRSPVYQALFTLYGGSVRDLRELGPFAVGHPAARLRMGPLELRPAAIERAPVQLDLALALARTGDGYLGSLRFNRDLFDATTGRRFAAALGRLLEAGVDRSDLALGALPLLGAGERQQALVEWNDTATGHPAPPVHEWVRRRASRVPEAIAVVGEAGEHVSYGELVRRTGRLAAVLAAHGVGPDVPVGVRLERSSAMVVALLGVLEAGGAYLPLDPAFPRERLELMLADSGAPLVLADDPAASAGGARLLTLDASGSALEASPADPPAVAGPAGGDGVAYLVYTSGSTGAPKGVEVRHRAVSAFLAAMARRPGLRTDDVLLSVTTPSFDIAVLEVFLPLVTGARLVVADRRTVADGSALRGALGRYRVTVLQATPATWRLLLTARWRGGEGLRVLCGGEALPRELADRLLPAAAELWNLYGPTETTVWSTVERVAGIEPGMDDDRAVTVGRPISDTRAFLADPGLRPVAIGVSGELLLGEVAPGLGGMARGYHRRPARTAERFVPDPFAGLPGGRLYRTGDLARRRPDGRLDYLGRFDQQVKLRGHRLELGEVESALAAHPAVSQAVVGVRDVAPGDRRLVAYVVPAAGERLEAGAIRDFVRERLPAVAVPSEVVALDELPLTPNRKVDRRALPSPRPTAARGAGAAPRSELERRIGAVWKEVLGLERVGVDDNFFDLGGHSLLAAEVHARLRDRLGLDLSLVDLFRFPTVASLARALSSEPAAGPAVLRPGLSERPAGGAVAVIGLAGRFPGAEGVDRLWQRLRAGEECLTRFSREELVASGVEPALVDDSGYVPAAGVLADADRFDARFFGFTPREAELMDPQHRVFLECAWHALEDAGYDPGRYPGRIGLFASAGINAYLLQAGLGDLGSFAGRYQAFIGNDKDFVPTRASYKLGLTGPSVGVQTACSSSLVAVHLARSSLLLGECEMALAGGVSVRVPLRQGYLHEDGGIGSPDGHCRAFDADAAGTVFGSGVGLVVLKPLERALADGDTVHAVLLGSAINNDGALKVGYTAPSVEGQAEVIARALESAGVDPGSISYVEAHGTGTAVGDPIEVAALAEVFGRGGPRPHPCALGSVKTNLGHLDTAAGVSGLIKTVLALRHGELPASLHFRKANPRLDLDAAGFRVQSEAAPWLRNGAPRRAGVSSFGIGGTNAHVVLEEPPLAEAPDRPVRSHQLLVVSAATPEALDRLGDEVAACLGEEAGPELADAAFTLAMGRKPCRYRRAVVARDAADAAAAFTDPGRHLTGAVADATVPVAFLLPGQGAQHPGMGAGLYAVEPVFRRELDRCARILEPWLGLDLRPLLDGSGSEAEGRLAETWLAQPAIFSVSWSLAQLWRAWGVEPEALLGHSLGEYVAATLAGVWSLEDALRLVAARGRLMQACPRGAMLSVALPERELAPRLGAELSLAAVNGPRALAVSGPAEAIDALAAELARDGVHHRRLHTSHAFHSALMDSILEAFGEELSRVPAGPPKVPVASNVTGRWLTGAEAKDPKYWLHQLRGTVRFADGLAAVMDEPGRVLLETGPGTALTELARQRDRSRIAVPSLGHPRAGRPEPEALLEGVGRLWIAGVAVDWSGFWAGERRRRVRLPGYPFERERYWLERAAPAVGPVVESRGPAVESREPGPRFYVPLWHETPPLPAPAPAALAGERWLLLGAEAPVMAALAAALRLAGGEPVPVRAGAAYGRGADGGAVLDPGSEDDHRALLDELKGSAGAPTRLVHGWSLAGTLPGEAGLSSLVALVRAVERSLPEGAPALDLLTERLHRVGGEGGERPEQALLAGALRVVSQEVPDLACRTVDVAPGPAEAAGALARDLLAELSAGGGAESRVVAHREGRRWRQGFGPMELAIPGHVPVRPDGGYLVTGGLGGLGLLLARGLAERGARRLVLLGRSGLPPRERWDGIEASGDAALARRIAGVRSVEGAGAEVLVLAADVTDPASLGAAVDEAEAWCGRLRGVVHAAGRPGGSLIQARSAEGARSVLAPKVDGTRALLGALTDRQPDFVVLCSSLNAVAGGLGQADYAAANAFLDAVAASPGARGAAGRVVSVGWDRWEGVGMAAPPALVAAADEPARAHPLAGVRVGSAAGRELHRAVLDPEGHWALGEHRVLGRPTLPGTACLEMVRAAFSRRAGGRAMVLRDVLFPAPLGVEQGTAREVVTVLSGDGDDCDFQVLSRPAGETANLWVEHARGRVATAEAEPGPARDLTSLAGRFDGSVTLAETSGRHAENGFLRTGERWHCLSSLAVADGESLASLELAPAYRGDLADHPLHPALLDVAVGAVRLLADGDYLPLAYDALEVHAPLSARCFSHARLRGRGGEETIRADLSILDEEGRSLAEVTGFSMRRVGEEAAAALRRGDGVVARVRLPEVEPPTGALAGGLSPEEGVETFFRVLAGARSPHVLVASRDLAEIVRERDALTPERAARELAERAAAPPAGRSRPELGTTFVEPGDETERRIASVWSRVLGVERVGRHDNFFELGGSSLAAVQLVSELKRELGVDELPTVTIFESPTVAALARQLRPADEGARPAAFEAARARAEKKKRVLSTVRPSLAREVSP